MAPKSDTPDSKKPATGFNAENTLREKMGGKIQVQSILSPEKLKACQELITKAHVDLFDDSIQNLGLIETEYQQASADLKSAAPHVGKIASQSFILKGRLEALGLNLGFEVAKSLYEYAKSLPEINATHMTVLRKHLDVLSVVLKQRMEGDGGEMGQNMLSGLAELIRKSR